MQGVFLRYCIYCVVFIQRLVWKHVLAYLFNKQDIKYCWDKFPVLLKRIYLSLLIKEFKFVAVNFC